MNSPATASTAEAIRPLPFDLLPPFAPPDFEDLPAAGFFADVFAVAVLLVDREPFAAKPDFAVVFEDLPLEALDPDPELFELAFDFDAADLVPVLDADAFDPDFAVADFDLEFDAEVFDPDLAEDAFVPDFAVVDFAPDFAEEVFDPDFAVADFDEALFRAVEPPDFDPPDLEPEDFFVVAILFSSATRKFS